MRRNSYVLTAASISLLLSAAVLPAIAQDNHEHHHGQQESPAPPAESDPHAGHSMPASGEAPHAHHDMAGMNGMDHSSMNSAGKFLMGESSGTGLQPSSWPMPMLMNQAGDWNLMWMGQAFLVQTQQSGPRGGDKLYSANWGMLGAVHKLGGGSFMLRSMLSLDPATVTDRRYPLLFQTGETVYGKPLVDGQHPHDFVMELSAQYAHLFAGKGMWNVYYAPVGDPALGPVAFPHRASAMELPQAALGHHWQDSTHIANNVLTTGVSYGKLRLEASGFHGREPNEGRWNIDFGKMDSWSTRLSVFPSRNWMGQVSVGRLHNPESTHPGDVVRTTASIQHVRPAGAGNYWATTLLWGENYKVSTGRTVHAMLAETVAPIGRKNFLTGRFEWSQRDELFEYDHHLAEDLEQRTGQHAFNVSAFTAGYTRDVELVRNLQTGIGANVTSYLIADALKPYYGSHPWGVNVFLRVRLKASE